MIITNLEPFKKYVRPEGEGGGYLKNEQKRTIFGGGGGGYDENERTFHSFLNHDMTAVSVFSIHSTLQNKRKNLLPHKIRLIHLFLKETIF